MDLGERYSTSKLKYPQGLSYQSSDEIAIPKEITGVFFIRCTQFPWDYWNF